MLISKITCPSQLLRNRISISPLSTGFAGTPIIFPSDWTDRANSVVRQCENFVEELVSGSSTPSQVVEKMDHISDCLCSICDPAEFCRNVHPDKQMVKAATNAAFLIQDFINRLNADYSLYRVSKEAEESGGLTEEEHFVISKLRAEFEHQGVHLLEEDRNRLFELQDRAARSSDAYLKSISKDFMCEVPITADQHFALPDYLKRISRKSNSSSYPFTMKVESPSSSTSYMSTLSVPGLRKSLFIASHSVKHLEHVNHLTEMVSARQRQAHLLGFQSYFELFSYNKVLKKPHQPLDFLQELSILVKPHAEKQMEKILQLKRESGEGGVDENIYIWDMPYYRLKLARSQEQISSRTISEYFSLANCLEGLRILCHTLFGIHLDIVPMEQFETWHQSVMKICVKDSWGETLGNVYMDLFQRPNKFQGAANFPIRLPSIHSAGKTSLGFVCNFKPGEPVLLDQQDFENLFHEFGHSLHCLLSKTKLQHTSGTRTFMDFVEAPSQLMEYFAWDYRVLSLFARHYKTGAVLPEEYLELMKRKRDILWAMDLQDNIFSSSLDIFLHGGPLTCSPLDVAEQLHARFTLLKSEPGLVWNGRMSHLVGYGGNYYGYLYSQMYSADIWKKCFKNDPLSREMGKKYEEMLACGGSKHPSQMLDKLIGTPDLHPGVLLEVHL
eukprot:TRINITY_DN5207_c0_g2_i7.p1 TRINITY_DN5207_c0_g2~~TRINITY_DN5207_c0_g2_i7.p1  ORF type:complete len:670 (-),score=113.56 TRINITY_DN5207_c0_g2_i7:89-2098(-)